jgi:hypothetical protein
MKTWRSGRAVYADLSGTNSARNVGFLAKDVLMRALAIIILVLLPVGSLAESTTAQLEFPTFAIIRGENIRVRAAPTEDAANYAILQRGDAVIITGAIEASAHGEFYPVEVPGSGAKGWVLWLAIDPRSIGLASARAPNNELADVVINQPPIVEAVEDETADNRDRG